MHNDGKRHLPLWLAVLCALFSMTSCGEWFEFEEPGSVVPTSMTIDSHDIVLMVGDSLRLTPSFIPDSVSLKTVFWYADSSGVASVHNGIVKALKPGEAKVLAVSVSGEQRDSCRVQVIDSWLFNKSAHYRYDMVVYASTRIDGLPEFSPDDYVLAAFVGDELRGVGVSRQAQGISYYEFRIYSNRPRGETVEIRAYRRNHTGVRLLTPTFAFDGETHGSLSHPEQLKVKQE
ncbi:Ig-like domain, group 2 [Segatella baroniae F0067]|uniref:Ig-like domain, group 2 n=2 Tax=Segatella baroniae TaxID=305719 RepID=U2QDD6_9BACT|nr:Ig-like domain, group 2 [Segatella baroniae F0067]